MFKDNKIFKDIESSCWSEESNDEMLCSFQKKLEKVFWKEQFSLGECKAGKTDLNFFEQHGDKFKKLINDTDPHGYGISDDFGYMLEDVRDELGYYGMK